MQCAYEELDESDYARWVRICIDIRSSKKVGMFLKRRFPKCSFVRYGLRGRWLFRRQTVLLIFPPTLLLLFNFLFFKMQQTVKNNLPGDIYSYICNGFWNVYITLVWQSHLQCRIFSA